MYPSKKRFKVLAAIPKKDGTSWWMNCGSMYEAKTPNTYNLYLDAVPTNNKDGRVMFHLREWTEEDMREAKERTERRSGSSSDYAARGTFARTDTNGSPMLGPDLPLFDGSSRTRDGSADQPPF